MKAINQTKTDIRNEIKCRPAGSYILIAALVEDYGPQVKKALWEMRADDEVRLVVIHQISSFLAEHGCDESSLIQGSNEVFGLVAC